MWVNLFKQYLLYPLLLEREWKSGIVSFEWFTYLKFAGEGFIIVSILESFLCFRHFLVLLHYILKQLCLNSYSCFMDQKPDITNTMSHINKHR